MDLAKALQTAAGNAGGDFYPYTVDYSCRFYGNDKLTWTVPSGGNRKTFTISLWAKPALDGTSSVFINADGSGTGDSFGLQHSGDSTLYMFGYSSALSYYHRQQTNQLYRDSSAWYHWVFAYDTTASTAADRFKLYVNGVIVDQSNWTTTNYLPLNADTGWNESGRPHEIGEYADDVSASDTHMYMAQVAVVDGQQLDASSFGKFKNGVWVPKDLSGLTWGNNGFWLDFADSSNLGNDVSGNNNDWTSSGLTSSDQMTDTPTNNFATMNGIFNNYYRNKKLTLAEGNLRTSGNTSESAGHITRWATKYFDTSDDTGYYFEVYIRSRSYYASANNSWGFENVNSTENNLLGNRATGVGLLDFDNTKSQIRENGSVTFDNLTQIATGNVVLGFAIKGNKVWMHIGGTWINSGNPGAGTGQVATLSDGLYRFGISGFGGSASNSYTSTSDINFGQNGAFNGQVTAGGNADGNGYGDFYYSVPSDFYSLCTANFPEPTIGPNSATTSDEHFDTLLWVGDGSSSKNVTGLDFTPDFTWIKNRTSSGYSHVLSDAVRGDNKFVASNGTGAEETDSTKFRTFVTGGIQVGSHNGVNQSASNHVAWNWKANGSGSSNTDGSITSTVSANQDAGISIITYTGNGTSGATIGHGLNAVPKSIWVKDRGDTNAFTNYFESLGTGSELYFAYTQGATSSNFWITSPTTSVFSASSSEYVNASAHTYVAYAFAEVDGFSKIGDYTGNGSTDGPFVYTGFRPAFVLVKSSTYAGTFWLMSADPNGYNVVDTYLAADSSNAEYSPYTWIDYLSNGFKLRQTGDSLNRSGQTYVYIAFAENPFKYSNAR